MSRKYREWKNDILVWRLYDDSLARFKLTLALYKKLKRQEQRIDKDAKKFMRENWPCYRHSQRKKRRKLK